MATTAAFCNSFKTELLAMTPHTAADVYKIALYTDAAATLATVTSAFAVGVWRSCWAIPTRGGLNRLCLMQP